MILFSAITKGSLILCDYTQSNEDFYSLTSKQLKFIKNNEEKQQFQINNFTMIVLQQKEYNFICMLQFTEEKQLSEQQVQQAYQFLTEIQEEFLQMINLKEFDKGQFTKVIASKLNKNQVQVNNFEQQIENHPVEIQNQPQMKQQYQIQEIKPYIDNIQQSYPAFTCKSLFFVVNLFLAGMLIELFTKFDKYL